MRTIASDLRFPEGPVVLPDGTYAVCGGRRITRITPDGETSILAKTGGMANGLAVSADGSILVANNGGVGRDDKIPGSIQRISSAGVVEVLAGDLDAPNDICVAPDGAVWFTDPRDSPFDTNLRPGRIYRLAEELELIHEGMRFPNGIGFDPAGRLVVAESLTRRLVVMDDGPQDWAQVPTGAPDGFCFDASGVCYVACFDAERLYVLDASGAVTDELPTGPDTWPTNCAIAPDGALLVTESKHGKLLAFDLGLVPGLPAFEEV